MSDPKFLTRKFILSKLSDRLNVDGDCLRQHFRNLSHLYCLTCQCYKPSDKEYVTNEVRCLKCKSPSNMVIPYKAMIYHDFENEIPIRCEPHQHARPCNQCLNCNIGQDCIIKEDFICTFGLERLNSNSKNKVLLKRRIPHDMIYDLKCPLFYICDKHKHKHRGYAKTCFVQKIPCCEEAVCVKDYTSSFVISFDVDGKKVETLIFDPTLWKEQPMNHFLSFVRAVIASPHLALERYKRFADANFNIGNIKTYKSGKVSVIRNGVTGFLTEGIYQTSTISCLIPYYVVSIPHKLYEMFKAQDFDMDLVLVKRDPSILPTCIYVCMAVKNPDPNVNVITISDQLSKGLNQDQDGDKNTIYLLKKKINGYDTTTSYEYKASKIELSAAFKKKQTVTGKPRYILSENSRLIVFKQAEHFKDLPFINYIKGKNPNFISEAMNGFFQDEYDQFQHRLCQISLNHQFDFTTLDDLLLKTSKFKDIIDSETKGNIELVKLLLSNISKDPPMNEFVDSMIALNNKYIFSSQDLSRNGRKQFAALYGAHDLMSYNFAIYQNKILCADYFMFSCAGTFAFNEASMDIFYESLVNS